MDKKTFLIAVSLIIIIFGAYFLLMKRTSSDKTLNRFIEEQVQSCLAEGQDSYNYVMAMKTKDASYCQKVEDRDFCIANINRDIGICNAREPSEISTCQAYILKDSSLCAQADFYCLAYTTGDSAYCNSLQEELREECSAVAELNADYYISKDRETQCRDEGFLVSAVMTGDYSYCERIKNQEIKEECLSKD